jgi:hypothetical protein
MKRWPAAVGHTAPWHGLQVSGARKTHKDTADNLVAYKHPKSD